ncbi:RNA polymerase sigma factor [Actinomarinicola tropica]|uniref:Sigma-70 family RNA polymerase sigma factor n=1 Tax=Actinomarinicola tropica TaxID=2789776 RepID=A0A5Q2RIG5_9ACTN|nr:sigma-70 family RNA polymerase sigma factor [Actinomarinicola tropica]QGG96658.1 sigma-70 family RNA polymerase sigma factor [Actinomarinicola tropica]
MSTAHHSPDPGAALLSIYDRALPQVYGYLVSRCGSPTIAEEVTAETFLAAAESLDRGKVPDLTVAWLVTVARNKLVDHWRREERERRHLQLVHDVDDDVDDPVDVGLDAAFDRARAHEVLAELGAHHRSALTLRYLDGLSVPEVAEVLGRTVHATEALLVRSRAAFRTRYQEGGGDDD